MTTTSPKPICKRGDVILVLFPHSDLHSAKLRPALVVQADHFQTGLPLKRQRAVRLAEVSLRLVGCTSTASFEETTSLAVPAKITARVDPALWHLEKRREMWDITGVVQVGQALAWILADDPQAPQALTYVSSRFTPKAACGRPGPRAIGGPSGPRQSRGHRRDHAGSLRALAGVDGALTTPGKRRTVDDDPL